MIPAPAVPGVQRHKGCSHAVRRPRHHHIQLLHRRPAGRLRQLSRCAAWRIVPATSVLRGRSHCDVCGHVLAPRALCRCSAMCSAMAAAVTAARSSPPATRWVKRCPRWYSCRCCCAMISPSGPSKPGVACLLLACPSRAWGYIIPDRFIAVGVVLLRHPVFVPSYGKRALDSLIGGVAVGGGVLLLALLMEKLLRRDAMGGGDIKLLFLTGLFLGWQKNLLCLLLACVVGILWGLVRAKRGQQGLPWGPASRWPPGAPPCSARTLSTGTCHCCNAYHRSARANTPANDVFPLLFALFALAGVSLAPKGTSLGSIGENMPTPPACVSKTKNHSKIHRRQVRSSFAGAEMGPDKKRPAENTCRIVKGLDAVWAHFCPPKPCLPLSIDGIGKRGSPFMKKNRWH